MTYRAEHSRPHVAVVGRAGPLTTVAVAAHVPVLDDDELVFGVIASEADEATVVAARVVALLNEHGLADVPDTPEAVADE